MRETFVEKVGVSTVVAVAAVVTIIYAFWGASILKNSPHHGIFSQTAAPALTVNL